jgi:hypothetical protein
MCARIPAVVLTEDFAGEAAPAHRQLARGRCRALISLSLFRVIGDTLGLAPGAKAAR